MARPSKYPRELRERAVRMVVEHRGDYPSEYAAITEIARKLGSPHRRCRASGFGRQMRIGARGERRGVLADQGAEEGSGRAAAGE